MKVEQYLANFIFGYFVPFFIVVSSILIDQFCMDRRISADESVCYEYTVVSSYGTKDFCWLRVDNRFVLSFIVPAVVVIFSNFGFLTFAIYTMFFHKIKTTNANNQNIILSYMKGVGVLMCLLGSTWIFGLLYLVINSLVLAYIFTVLNCLQGVGIFIFQCLLNPSVHSESKRRISSFLNSLVFLSDSSSSALRNSGGDDNAKTAKPLEEDTKNDIPLNERKSFDS